MKEIQKTFRDLLSCYENIQREFARIDDRGLDEFLGEYNTEQLRSQVRRYGDGHTLHSIPEDADAILDIDALVVVVMNSPKLNWDSNFNPFKPIHSVSYWQDGKGIRPYVTVRGQRRKLNFMVWEQVCSIHGKTDSNARKNQNFLQGRYPRLRTYLQEERQASDRFILQYVDWLTSQGKQVVVLTNFAKRKFNPPIPQLLTSPQVVHIPTKLFGPNRKIMGYISDAMSGH